VRDLAIAEQKSLIVRAPPARTAPARAPAITPSDLARDYDAIVAVAAMAGVSVRSLEAIGATGGRRAEDVNNGEDLPEPPESLGDQRIIAADGVLRLLVTRYCAYYSLRNNRRAQAEPWVVSLAGESSGTGEGSDTSMISPSDLDVESTYYRPYRDALAAARASAGSEPRWPEAILQFSIESFCGIAMRIAAGGSKKFATVAIQHATRAELRYSIPGEFRWTIFGDAEDSRGMSGLDASQDDFSRYGEAGTGSEDVGHADDLRQGEGSGDPFSLEHVDIDRATAESNLDQ
jgi:hypothetical protein